MAARDRLSVGDDPGPRLDVGDHDPAFGFGHAGAVHACGDLGNARGQRWKVPHRRARAGQHQVGVHALQRVDPFTGRHLLQRFGQGAHVGRLPLGQRADQL
ncbi:hypothetical protein G6F57_021666 [Rhizopus arrhizus]|nr:hypothetical protein G6F57_021666 [Rhizopus arrhizus]